MKLQEKEWFDRIKRDFKQLQTKKIFTAQDEGKILAELTGLLGWFNLDPDRQIKTLIEEMLIFSEKQKWSAAGPRTAFERIKRKHKN